MNEIDKEIKDEMEKSIFALHKQIRLDEIIGEIMHGRLLTTTNKVAEKMLKKQVEEAQGQIALHKAKVELSREVIKRLQNGNGTTEAGSTKNN